MSNFNPMDMSQFSLDAQWQRERRDAWVSFAAAELAYDGQYDSGKATRIADILLAEFDKRFGPKEGT